MAENWKNNILPNSGSLDLGSLSYTADDSLTDIAAKYTNLGSQVNSLAKAAADDVHTRQVKLIGNDFGPVNPMMYATYYQPTANDIQSEMRMKGTEKALEEGMERGKAAAEADAKAAQNEYSNALDGYNNAKEAYANLKVAMTDSSLLPDGTNESEAFNFMNLDDRDAVRFQGLKNYTDQINIDWSDKDVWDATAGKVVNERAGDTSGWKDEDWSNFWGDNAVGADFTRYYISAKLEKDRGAEAAAQFNTSVDNVLRNMDAIFDKVNNITENLPELSWDVYVPDEANLTKDIAKDESVWEELTRDTAANSVAKYRKDEWIEENIADEYQEQIKQLAAQQKAEFEEFQKQHDTRFADQMQQVEAFHKQLAQQHIETIKTKVRGAAAESEEFNFEMKQETQNLNDVLKDVFGFDSMDMIWLDKWRDQCPEEYESYKNQLAQVMGLADTLEVADGEKYYWTGKEYEQLPAGTPVFYAYSGAVNDQGEIVDSELESFVKMWKDYYSADVDAISSSELSTKQDALNEAYGKYMQHVSAALMVNANLNVKVTSDVYNAVLSNFESDISKSDRTIDGQKISDWLADFRGKSQAEKYKIYTDLVKSAYSKAGKFLRFSADYGGIVAEDLNYKDDSDAAGYSKLDNTQTAYGTGQKEDSVYANMDAENAAAYLLVLTRSMEQFNNGTNTGANIDPEFMDRKLMQNRLIDLGSQLAGTVSFWESVAALLGGIVKAPFTGKNAVDNEFFGIEGTSAANVLGSMFSGTREYNMDDPLQAAQYLTSLDETNREYAMSVINPLLIDVYFGDKEFSDVRGVGDSMTTEGQFNLNAARKFYQKVTNMFLVNWMEGKLISGTVEGASKAISATANSKVGKVLESRILSKLNTKKGADIYAEVLSQVGTKTDNIDDLYQVRNVLADPSKVDDLASLADKTDDLASLGLTTHADDAVELGSRMLDVTKNAETLKSFKSGNYGVLTPTIANALSSLSSTDLDDMLITFKDFVKEASATLKESGAAGLELIDVPLKNGKIISALEASAALTADTLTTEATLALATGIPMDSIAQLPRAAQKTLIKTLNGMTSASQSTITNSTLGQFLRSMTPDDFKGLVAEFISRNEVNQLLGKKWDMFDTYRAAGAAGWERSGTAALVREFKIDALTDPLRDFKRNVSQPQVDREGNVRVQTVQEYFTDPGNLAQNLAISAGHFAVSRMYNQVAGTVTSYRANKAWDAYNATGDKASEAAAEAYTKAVKLNAKAQKYADKAWKRGLSYEKASKNAELSNKIVDDAVAKIFTSSGWDLDYAGKTKHFDSADDYIDFMTNKNMPTKDGLFVLANSTNIKAINNYYMYKTQIGSAWNEAGNIPQSARISLLDNFRNTLNDNLESIKNGKGSFDEKNHAMYMLMKDNAIEANKAGEFGVTIRNLDKSLTAFFGNLEAMSKAGRADGTLKQQRIGYIPTASFYFDGSFDDMKASHTMAATRGLLHEGGSVDVSAANPAEARDLYSLDSLLDAMKRGDKTFDVKDSAGNVLKTVQIDYDGTNLIDMMSVYSNNYNLHKYIDPLMGNNRTDFGGAALQNNHAYVIGDWNKIQKAWTTDYNRAKNRLTGYNFKDAKGKTVHHEGWLEKIAARAVTEGELSKADVETLMKKGSLEFNVKEADKAKLGNLRDKYKAASAKAKNAKAILDQGDAPDSVYPLVSTIFHLDKNGVPDIKGAEEILDNGGKVAKILVDAYGKGELTEDNLKTGYTIKTKSGMRDLYIDEHMLDMLDTAAKNNGQINSDLKFYAAVQAEQAAPYTSISTERGITTKKMNPDYRNRLLEPEQAKTKTTKEVKPASEFTVANKELAVKTTGNQKGMMTFGGKEVTNARTGKVSVVGGTQYDAVELYSTEYRLGRNESGDVIEKTSESKMAVLEDATEKQIYASMGTKTKNGEYAPTTFQKRYAESVIDRTKTELGDSADSFNGSEWIRKIDKNAGDPELVKAYGVDADIKYTSVSKDGTKTAKSTSLAAQVKSLEQSGAMGAFRNNLEYASIDIMAGKYDYLLPEGMTRAELATLASRAKAFMETADDYANHPKSAETITAKVDENGVEMDMEASYKDAFDEAGEQVFMMTGRTIDLDKTNVTEHFKAFKEAVWAFADESHPLHEVFTNTELENLRAKKIEFNTETRSIAEELNTQAKNLYDSGANPEFNKRVDQVYQNMVARSKGHAGNTENIKYQYLEALGVAAPGSGINSLGTGSYGQSTRRYYAARMANATGIEDMSVEGWSAEVTKMRLDAGEHAGYAKQLIDGIKKLTDYSSETDDITKLANKARKVSQAIDSLAVAKRPDSADNFENSVMAIFADVYDRKAMSPVANKAEIEQSGRDMKWRLDNLISELLTGKKAHTEGMSVTKVAKNGDSGVQAPANKMINDVSAVYDAHSRLQDAEYFTQYGKHDPEAVDPGISLVDAQKAYDEAFEKLYAQYGKGASKEQFEDRLITAKRQAQKLLDDYHALQKEYAQMGGDNIVAPSAQQGKGSIFTPTQLSYTAAKPTKRWISDDFFVDVKIDSDDARATVELDFGTAQELSDTAVGLRVMRDTGDEVDIKNLSQEEHQRIINEVIAPYLEESGSGLKVSNNSGDETLQDLGYGYKLVGTPREDEPLNESSYFRGKHEDTPQEVSDKAVAQYAYYTKNYNPAKQLEKAKKDYASATKELESLKTRGEAAADKVKKGTVTIDDMAKKVLTDEEYARYKEDADNYRKLRDAKPTKQTDFYEAAGGKYKLVSGKSLPSGYTTLKTLLELTGYDPEKFNHDISAGRIYTDEEVKADLAARKKMMKQVNKNLRAGNARYRNVEAYKNPSALDIKSQTATINNLLAFGAQVSKTMGLKNGELVDPANVAIDKDYGDMLFRISREGVQPKNVKGTLKSMAFEISDWNKFIQDFQLAGGASYINAMSIAQMRGAILSNPTKMAEYIRLVTDFKDDPAVANFIAANGAKLSDIAMKVGDASILTDFQASASAKPGMEDTGTLASATNRILEGYNNMSEGERAGFAEKYGFAKEQIQSSVNSLFADATFNRMLPVLRAKMLIMNYDNAVRELKAHFKNIDAETLNDAACKYSYARTTAFFEPNKTAGGVFKNKSITETLNNIYDDNLRKFLASWTGAKDEISVGQMASNMFFALGYKQRMIQPLAQGAKSMFGIGNIKDRMSMMWAFDEATPDLIEKLGTQFMQGGNRQQIRSLATIALGAFLSAKALGLATSWDDLSFTDEADGEFKVPDILKKFQTIGQIWIPNAIDENGVPYIDPTKTAYNIDTMSSIFTLPNVGWKTIDRIFNPNAYYSAPQRGVGLIGQEMGINAQGLNDFLNTPLMRGIGDELIGSNLLSPYKAMYEVLVDSSYYGNNIWEKKWLSDGSENPNYDPVRNIKASFFHILGLDNYRTLSPRKYNDYVKGYYTDDYVSQDQIGSISGAGILQHEYITAVFNILEGDALEGVIEAGELPIKKQKFSSTARTDFNTRIKNIIAEYMAEYNNKTANETSVDVKDAVYADTVKKCADAVAAWSKKYGYVLGRDQSLVPYVTRSMMAVLAGEYDDRLDYIQNTYWKASQIAQIESSGPGDYWLNDSDADAWLKAGKTTQEFAEEKNRRHEAYNQALEDEYKARKALHDAGIDNEYLAGMDVKNLKAEQRAVNKAAYYEAIGAMESRVGEFANFKEMKAYYEAQIDASTNKKTKVKLANQYNKYVTDALAPLVAKYGAGIIEDGYYNNNYLSNHLAEYIIIPADQYYTGKSPRASYLRDLFGVGYKNSSNEPSDKEVIEGYAKARKQMIAGNSASAIAALDRTIEAIKKGQLHVTDSDYSKIIRMKALLSARSK